MKASTREALLEYDNLLGKIVKPKEDIHRETWGL
ncbi:hypothetical protein L195_g041362, partial [Trifolium pratense]